MSGRMIALWVVIIVVSGIITELMLEAIRGRRA